MNHLVSIALCTYNGEKHLKEQLDSVINQTYSSLEIIICDDASTDKTVEILEQYQLKDNRITTFRNEKNIGYVKNFEKAIRACSGDFIALCDQDDIWNLNKIRVLLKNIGNNLLIYHDSNFIDENSVLLHRKMLDIKRMYSGNDPRHLLLENCVSGHSCMFRSELKKAIFPFPEVQYHDWWIGLAACSASSIIFINQPLVFYRQHDFSHTDILSKKKKQSASNRINFQRRQNLLEASVALQKEQYFFCKNLSDLYRSSKKKFLNFQLFYFVYVNRKILFYCRKKSRASIFFETLKYLWGLRLRRFYRKDS